MGKFTDEVKDTLQGYFNLGDVPTEAQYAEWIAATQEGIQEHEHTATGGAGAGTGDAGPVRNLRSGLAAARPSNPEVGDVYLETDTEKLLVCFAAGVWVEFTAS